MVEFSDRLDKLFMFVVAQQISPVGLRHWLLTKVGAGGTAVIGGPRFPAYPTIPTPAAGCGYRLDLFPPRGTGQRRFRRSSLGPAHREVRVGSAFPLW